MKAFTTLAATLAVVITSQSLFAQRPEGDQRRGFRPPPNPFMEALDTDKDGEISADELKNAAKSLATLDKNNDGKLTVDEVRPPRPEGGQGRGDMIARLMERDADKDGKLSKEELPEFLRDRLMRADSNEDGFLEKSELEKMSQGRRGGRPGGDRPDGDRPRGDRPDGDKPKGERGKGEREKGDRPKDSE